MPHGALDIYLASKILAPKYRWSSFIAIYLAVGLLMAVFWLSFPTASFIFFLVYSMIHFADSDMQKPLFSDPLNALEFFARLFLPFSLPLVFHEASTLGLIRTIHSEIDFVPFVPFFRFTGYAGLALTAAFVAASAIKSLKLGRVRDLNFLEPVVLVVLFSQIEPLYSLGIYFCFIHAIKHLTNVVMKIEVKSFARILPYWLIPLSGLPLLFWIYLQLETPSTEALQAQLFQYVLITLSIVALPHALLVRQCKSLGVIS